jgi:hypothetical protein
MQTAPVDFHADPELTDPVHGLATVHTFDPSPSCLGDNCWHAQVADWTHPNSDMHNRWRMTLNAHATAMTLLAQHPAAEYAVVVLVQPGKGHGWWGTGQPVETVPGVVLLAQGRDSTTDGVVLGYPAARNLAGEIGKAYLAGREGTTAHVLVERTGDTFVHEDI